MTVATAVYSAIMGLPVDNRVAMTGEVSIRGLIKPVGGIVAKVEAARQAGARKVIIPIENDQELLKTLEGIEVIPVERLEEVFRAALVCPPPAEKKKEHSPSLPLEVLSASVFGAGQPLSK